MPNPKAIERQEGEAMTKALFLRNGSIMEFVGTNGEPHIGSKHSILWEMGEAMTEDKIRITIPEHEAKQVGATIAMYLADEIPSKEAKLGLKIFMRMLTSAKPDGGF